MKSKNIDYILIGIVVALTGFEYAYRSATVIQISVLCCIAIYFFGSGKKISSMFYIVFLPFALSFLFQALLFPDIYLFAANSISLMIKFMTCYMVLEIVKYNINKTLIGFMFFLAIFSFIFYPTQFFPGLQDLIKNSIGSIITPLSSENVPAGFVSKTLIFFTYIHNYGGRVYEASYRNCGAFWEPGMFAIFLNLALMINLFVNKAPLLSTKNIVFIIALITTLSTTGFIVSFLIIVSSLILNQKAERAILYIPFLITISFIAYTYVWKLDFMSGKISEQTEDASYNRSSRFGAALYHFELLKESPLTGVFLSDAIRNNELNYKDQRSSANGISLIFMVWGIPVGLIYFIFIYSGLARWLRHNNVDNRLIHFLFFFVVILSSFSQDITNRHFYFLILLLVAVFPRYPVPKPINI